MLFGDIAETVSLFHRKEKSQGFPMGKDTFGAQKSRRCDFSPASEKRNRNHRGIATLGALSPGGH